MSFPHGTVLRPAVERFFEKVATRDDGCWEWTAGIAGQGGYGYFYRGRTGPGDHGRVYAHRWSYEYHIGPIPDGLVIDHLCRNHRCVNPEHLEPVPQKVNIHRGVGNGTETHCPSGHPYSGDNLYVSPKGTRFCRECARVSHGRIKARSKQQKEDD